MLSSKDKYFAHVTFNVIAMQVKNVSLNPYTILKNFKVRHIRDYDKKNCFLTTSENCHLAMTSVRTVNIKEALLTNEKKTILPNDITIYENKKTVNKI